MSKDGLFQLGMGAIGFDAPQKEETSAHAISKMCARVFQTARRCARPEPFMTIAHSVLRGVERARGNNAMARIPA